MKGNDWPVNIIQSQYLSIVLAFLHSIYALEFPLPKISNAPFWNIRHSHTRLLHITKNTTPDESESYPRGLVSICLVMIGVKPIQQWMQRHISGNPGMFSIHSWVNRFVLKSVEWDNLEIIHDSTVYTRR